MKCVSCKDEYGAADAGTCRECYEEASETEEELKREIEELKLKVNFLRFWTPLDSRPHHHHRSTTPCFTDVLLVAFDEDSGKPAANSVPVPANKAVLASRSPVFRAMLETEMEESLSGTIKLSDVSYDALRAFVNYLYTAEACLDDEMACDLLVLADKYEVKHLKSYCEKYLISKLNWESSLLSYSFAHRHNANNLLDAALSLILENMEKVSKVGEYMELVEKDPRLLVEIYEAYLSKQVNTAAATVTVVAAVGNGNKLRKLELLITFLVIAACFLVELGVSKLKASEVLYGMFVPQLKGTIFFYTRLLYCLGKYPELRKLVDFT